MGLIDQNGFLAVCFDRSTAKQETEKMRTKNIEFQFVRVGDEIFMHADYISDFEKVTEVSRYGNDVRIKIGVTAHPAMDTRTTIHGHARQGIAIRADW